VPSQSSVHETGEDALNVRKAQRQLVASVSAIAAQSLVARVLTNVSLFALLVQVLRRRWTFFGPLKFSGSFSARPLGGLVLLRDGGCFCCHVAHFVAFSRSRVALTVLVPEVRLAAHPGRTALADLELDQRDWEEYRADAAAEQGRARQLSSACCCFATMSWRGFDLRIVSEQRGRCSAVPPKSLTSAADGADASKLVLRERPHAFYGAHLQQKAKSDVGLIIAFPHREAAGRLATAY